jgi:uncharacterized protein
MVDSGDRSGSGKRRLFSLLCHGSIFLGSLLITSAIPLAILLLFDDPVIKATAKETLNYHFNIWLYGAITAGLIAFLTPFSILILPIFLIWGIGGAFFLFHLVPPIFGILATLNNPNEPYRYPFIWRLL